ncbi:MAG: putative repeat domain [Pseudomonadota bacterium]|jgi:tetratricopeptide (TPR) repeat protein
MNKKIFYIVFLLLFIANYSHLNANILDNKKRLVKNSNYFSNYLSGSVSLQKNDSQKAYGFFENIENLGTYHSEFNLKYVETLVNNGKIEEAYIFIKKLDKSYQSLYPFNLILFVYDFKKERYSKLKNYISLPKQSLSDPLLAELYQNLSLWADLSNKNIEELNQKIGTSNSSFKNVSLTQKILINLYLDNPKNIDLYFNEISNKKELGRYNYFYLSYYLEKNNKDKINDIINRNLEISSENLLFKQLFLDSRENKFYKIDKFYKRKNINHGLAELFYLFANFYQNYEQVQISNFYLNLSEYLNPNFQSNKILKVENLIILNNLEQSEKEIKVIEKLGKEFYWYANLTRLRFLPNINSEKQINLLESFLKNNEFFASEKYFELANFVRVNKNYSKSIELYEKSIASKKDKKDGDWIYYYNLAISQERAGLWENAEKSFLQALKISPKQPEVLNYLAYSWLEKKINLDKAKEMLVEAVNISKGRGYILDSLGWAYFLLKDYDKAEEILQTAYEKEPSEAVIYDHYGDVLWTNGKEIQARYVWQNAIKLKNIEQDLKESINKKIIFGLDYADKNKS